MKIRSGFVSNSSSSSFVAVGIGRGGWNATEEDKQLWQDLMNAMGLPTRGYDYDDFYDGGKYPNKLTDYDYGTYKTVDGTDICLYGGYEFYFAGLDAMPLFEKDMKLSEIKKKFQEIIKKHYGVKIKLSQIELRSDEVSSE